MQFLIAAYSDFILIHTELNLPFAVDVNQLYVQNYSTFYCKL